MSDWEKLKFLNAYFDTVEKELSSKDVGSVKMQNQKRAAELKGSLFDLIRATT